MADDASPSPVHRLSATVAGPNPQQLVRYIEDMALQLAELASSAGETALAASLTLVAIQAGAAGAAKAAPLSESSLSRAATS